MLRVALTDDVARVCRLNAFLGSVNIGDYVMQGQLEAYSCA
jgi:hypothetical protein